MLLRAAGRLWPLPRSALQRRRHLLILERHDGRNRSHDHLLHSGAAIHYTTDGSTPTFSATTYSGPIAVTGNGTVMTIKAIGTKSGMTDSAPAQQTYKINYDQVSTPLFNPGAETS